MEYKTCCFFGSRPNKLPWGYEEKGIRYFFFRQKLKKTVIGAIGNGYIHFISGMALGIDTIAAEIVLELKAKYSKITLECAIPCINQTEKWSEESIMRYQNICAQADKLTLVSDTW